MTDHERVYAVSQLIADYVRSPSLRHLRDPHSIWRLSTDIVNRLDRGSSVWKKWDEHREAITKAAAPCWVPVKDLRDFLNSMSGPSLTSTDIVQRMRVFTEEPFAPYPNDELREGCEALYAREKAAGTEMPAIVGALREYVEAGEQRLRQEREERYRRLVEEERQALEQRFLSGADCKWTPIGHSKEFYCRMNGRSYRLTPTADKMWQLHRIEAIGDKGALVGKYQKRGDATKALAQVAYQPDPRW